MVTAAVREQEAGPLPAERTAARVVVGVDGSSSSVRALAWAAGEAEQRHSLLQVVSAWHPVSSAYQGTSDLATIRGRRRVLGELIVELLGTRPGIDVVVDVVRGSPAPVLLEAAEESALLVLGHRGRGGFEGLRLGSVGLHCVMHASCPVAIVKEEEQERS